jgi:type II secretory ATPase GspE/PulE/Tfp pilus assembly ATPase PilB-like protein
LSKATLHSLKSLKKLQKPFLEVPSTTHHLLISLNIVSRQVPLVSCKHMPVTDEHIIELLISQHYLSSKDAQKAKDQLDTSDTSIVQYLQDSGLVTKQLLGQALAESFGVPYVDIGKQNIDDSIFFQIPELTAKSQRIVALTRLKGGIKVALSEPTNKELVATIEKRFDEPIIPYFALDTDIETALGRYKANLSDAFHTIVDNLKNSNKQSATDDVITRTVDLMLEYGNQNHVSDIHIQPHRKHVVVRFRIDGVLHDVLDIEKELFAPVLSRIKILSKMRTDEHRAAQDGKMRFNVGEDEVIDIRVSVVPTSNGENIVMRLLSAKNRQFSLSSLGMGDKDFEVVGRAIKHPHGMILVTGPTGSGKSTTLYAVLKILNKKDVNIATIEDPVEYDVEGITQIQVNTRTGLTFAQGLRAIVRQDPDIIMVGEIRDEETASISVNSALTGHLVLSTLHTNDAATTLPRLLDMSVEPFLVASTVNVIIAQRLVRNICQTCRVSYAPTDKETKILTSDKSMKAHLKTLGVSKLSQMRLYKGSGCKVCNKTGYTGRSGLFEILEMTDHMRELVMKNVSADDIKDAARKAGMTTMMEDGFAKVLQGVTTLEEVLRVARD